MSVPTKELKFIHITKTAGTSIETVGLEKNKRWGINHTEYGFWHSLFPEKPLDLKEKYDWFMVVRNPYNRILSEYHFLVGALGYKHTKDEFNLFINKWIKNASKNIENHSLYGRKGGDHFTEQYKYLDSSIPIHILKFENIKEDFNELMKKYSYNIILNKKIQISKKIFGVNDFSNKTLELIKEVYKKDFELFGYSMDITDLLIEPVDVHKKIEKPLVVISPKNKIRYIPITRNGNKYITDIASNLNLKWGETHLDYGWRFEAFVNKNASLKNKFDWFLVVRDPYTRILSEYDFINKAIYAGKKHSVDEFNSIITKWIQNVESGKENHPKFGKQIGDHFTEQYKYYDPNVTTHIVKYENLQDELNIILSKYDITPITKKFNIESDFIFSIDDISCDNIKLINKVYRKDFEIFNYDIQEIDSSIQKSLKFIHITRTAGTSIEQEGLDKNIFWGRYDMGYGIFDESFTLKRDSLKRNYSWFTVVRNPYTRLISEYNYLSVILRIKNSENIDVFNSYIEKWLLTLKNSGKVHGWHLIPQYTYIDSNYDINILKYENLENDFNRLMIKYDYNIKLNKKICISNSLLKVKDISLNNIELIKNIYKKDFEMFGYPVVY
jgi:hypothetical protein